MDSVILPTHSQFAEDCIRSPAFFCEKVLDAKLYGKQKDILEAVASHKKVAVRSGHSMGKSYSLAHVALWFLYTHPDSIVLVLGPTESQVRDVLFREIRRAHSKSRYPLPGEVMQTRINIADKWYAVGRATKEGTNLQGYHAEHILIAIDEAPGIPEDLWPSINGIATSSNSYIVAIGNPTRSAGMFYDISTQPRLGWHPMQLSCFDSPNVIAGEDVIPGLATRRWIEEREEEYGAASNLFRVRVLGEFPDEGEDTLFRVSLIEAAVNSPLHDKAPAGEIRIGVDIARYGQDESVATVRQGPRVLSIDHWGGRDLMYSTGRIISVMSKYPGINCRNVAVDDASVGGGVVDRLKELGRPVRGINFGMKPANTMAYADWKSEAYSKLQREFEMGEIAIPNNGKLIRDLSNIRVAHFKSDGRMRLVSKDEMRRHGIPSPDYADSLLLCSALNVHVAQESVPRDPEEVNRMVQEAIWRKVDPSWIERRERKKTSWRGIRLA